jgi:hypothetical protein
VFGIRGPVEGTVEVSKPKGLVFVAVRVRVPRYLRANRWNFNLSFYEYFSKLN